jgi:hypothetical protein
LFPNDPILSKMMDPNILWGDLLKYDIQKKHAKPSKPSKPIMTRKAIQKKFPVLVRLQSSQTSQSAKTLGIQWNMSKLMNWRTNSPNPLDWKTYEVQTARTLIDELCSSGWNVSAPSDASFICSIEYATPAQPLISWEYEEPDCPTMICLNDIKLFFPVIWHKLGSNDCKMYSVELYNDKIRSMAVTRGIDSECLTNHLSTMLWTTLNQSPAWKVLASSMPGEHSRLVL